MRGGDEDGCGGGGEVSSGRRRLVAWRVLRRPCGGREVCLDPNPNSKLKLSVYL